MPCLRFWKKEKKAHFHGPENLLEMYNTVDVKAPFQSSRNHMDEMDIQLPTILNENGDPYDMDENSDAECSDIDDYLEQCMEELEAKQAKYEKQAQDIHASMSPDKRVRLGSLRGNWTLYSSQALEACADMPDEEYTDEDWTAGELEIKDGISFFLTGSSSGNCFLTAEVPEFASPTPIGTMAIDVDEDEKHWCYITFLGRRILELRVKRTMLQDGITSPDLYYVAVMEKSQAEIYGEPDYSDYSDYSDEDSEADSEKSWETEDEWEEEQ